MYVFVWKNYGNIKVYAASTFDDLSKILSEIAAILNDWEETVAVNSALLNFNLAQDKSNIAAARKAIMTLIRLHIGSHETFENAEFSFVIGT